MAQPLTYLYGQYTTQDAICFTFILSSTRDQETRFILTKINFCSMHAIFYAFSTYYLYNLLSVYHLKPKTMEVY